MSFVAQSTKTFWKEGNSMKIEMGPKTLAWMGTGIQVAMAAIKGINFTLQQMVTKTAGKLDVAESAIEIGFGRSEAGHWGWRAIVTKADVRHTGSRQQDPMHALGVLVEEIES